MKQTPLRHATRAEYLGDPYFVEVPLVPDSDPRVVETAMGYTPPGEVIESLATMGCPVTESDSIGVFDRRRTCGVVYESVRTSPP